MFPHPSGLCSGQKSMTKPAEEQPVSFSQLPPPWKGQTLQSRCVRPKCIGGPLMTGTVPGHLSLCPEAEGQTQPRTWHVAFYRTRFCDPDTLGATFSLCLTQFWQIQWSHSSVTRTHQWWSPPSSSSALHCPPLWVSLHHPDGGYSTPSTPNRQTCSSRKALFLLWKHCVRIHEAEWGACCSLFITTKPAFTFELFQAKL